MKLYDILYRQGEIAKVQNATAEKTNRDSEMGLFGESASLPGNISNMPGDGAVSESAAFPSNTLFREGGPPPPQDYVIYMNQFRDFQASHMQPAQQTSALPEDSLAYYIARQQRSGVNPARAFMVHANEIEEDSDDEEEEEEDEEDMSEGMQICIEAQPTMGQRMGQRIASMMRSIR